MSTTERIAGATTAPVSPIAARCEHGRADLDLSDRAAIAAGTHSMPPAWGEERCERRKEKAMTWTIPFTLTVEADDFHQAMYRASVALAAIQFFNEGLHVELVDYEKAGKAAE